MGSLRILDEGLMTSLQDQGRKGYAYYGVPRSGVMDVHSANLANGLLSNPLDYPIIECTLLPPKMILESNASMVFTGADFGWKINGYSIQLNRVYKLIKGDVVEGQYAKEGFRGYIGVKGKIEGMKVYNSISYYAYGQIGNIDGSALEKDQRLSWVVGENEPIAYKGESISFSNKIGINKSPEFRFLDSESKALLTKEHFRVSSQSNRMGARLDGPNLIVSQPFNQSCPLIPGCIQLPPGGMLIVVLQDGQCTGGYPRIAYLNGKALAQFNQIKIGEDVQFYWLT